MEFTPLVFYKILCDIIRAMPPQTDSAGNILPLSRLNTFVVANDEDYYKLPETDTLRRNRSYINSGVFFSRINENQNEQSPNLISYEYPLAILVPLAERYDNKARAISYILNLLDKANVRDSYGQGLGEILIPEVALERLADLYQKIIYSVNDFVFARATLANVLVSESWIAKTELERLKVAGTIDKWDIKNKAESYVSGFFKATAQQSEEVTSQKLLSYAVNFDIRFQTPCGSPIESYENQNTVISQKPCC